MVTFLCCFHPFCLSDALPNFLLILTLISPFPISVFFASLHFSQCLLAALRTQPEIRGLAFKAPRKCLGSHASCCRTALMPCALLSSNSANCLPQARPALSHPLALSTSSLPGGFSHLSCPAHSAPGGRSRSLGLVVFCPLQGPNLGLSLP